MPIERRKEPEGCVTSSSIDLLHRDTPNTMRIPWTRRWLSIPERTSNLADYTMVVSVQQTMALGYLALFFRSPNCPGLVL